MPDDTDNGGTTDDDYRWKWLSTIYVFAYGLAFPAWVFGSTLYGYGLGIDGSLMGIMVLAWLACIVYVVGPETVDAAKSLRD